MKQQWQHDVIHTFQTTLDDSEKYEISLIKDHQCYRDIQRYMDSCITVLRDTLQSYQVLDCSDYVLASGAKGKQVICQWMPPAGETILHTHCFILHHATAFRIFCCFSRVQWRMHGAQVRKFMQGVDPLSLSAF